MNSSNNVVSLAGRILLSAIFIFSGIGKIAAFSMYTGYAGAHLPMPSVAIAVAIAVEVLGGLAILVGFQTRIAAWIVFLYLIPTSFVASTTSGLCKEQREWITRLTFSRTSRLWEDCSS